MNIINMLTNQSVLYCETPMENALNLSLAPPLTALESRLLSDHGKSANEIKGVIAKIAISLKIH